jgi:CheY-like chemotaxis protein
LDVAWRTDVTLPIVYHDHRTAKGMMNINGGRVLILVAEDVEETRDGIEKLLLVDGYRVDPARDEADAVLRARREAPDLILVSLQGQHVDVIAAARRIREAAHLSEGIPVVIFCVEAIPEGAEVGIGKNVYATRPDNFNQLRGFLRRLLKQPVDGPAQIAMDP